MKNKRLKNALNLDLPNYTVKRAQKELSKGISNFQTKSAIKSINDQDLNDFFVG